jgi:chromosome segregation ATPase
MSVTVVNPNTTPITTATSQQSSSTSSSNSSSYPLAGRCCSNWEVTLLNAAIVTSSLLAVASFVFAAYPAGALFTVATLLFYSNRHFSVLRNEADGNIQNLENEKQALLIEKQRVEALATQLRIENEAAQQQNRQLNTNLTQATAGLANALQNTQLLNTRNAQILQDIAQRDQQIDGLNAAQTHLADQMRAYQEIVRSFSQQVANNNTVLQNRGNAETIPFNFDAINAQNLHQAHLVNGVDVSTNPDLVQLNHHILNQTSLALTLVNQLVAERNELRNQKAQLINSHGEIGQIREQIEQLATLKGQLDIELQNKTDGLQKLNEGIADAQRTLEQDTKTFNDRSAQIKIEIDRMREETERQTTARDALVTVITELNAQKELTNQEIAQLHLTKQGLVAEETNLKNQIATKNEQITALSTKIEQLTHEANEKQSTLPDTVKDLMLQVDEKKQEIAKLETQHKTLSNNLTDLENKISVASGRLDVLKPQLEQDESRAKTLGTQIASRETELQDKERELESLTDKVRVANAELDSLSAQVKVKTSDIAQLEEKKSQLASNISEQIESLNQLEEKKNQLLKSNEEKTEAVNRLETLIAERNQKAEELAAQNLTLTSQINTNTTASQQLTAELGTLTSNKAALEESIRQLTLNQQNLTGNNTSLTDQIDNKTVELATLSTQISEKTTAIQILEQQKLTLTQQLEQKNEYLNQQIIGKQTEIEDLLETQRQQTSNFDKLVEAQKVILQEFKEQIDARKRENFALLEEIRANTELLNRTQAALPPIGILGRGPLSRTPSSGSLTQNNNNAEHSDPVTPDVPVLPPELLAKVNGLPKDDAFDALSSLFDPQDKKTEDTNTNSTSTDAKTKPEDDDLESF